MKVRLFGIFATAIFMLNSWASKAQELPLMPQDPAVQSSVFPNGLSCYAVGNATAKDVADITLIKRDYDGNDVVSAHRNVVLSSEEAVDSMLLGIMRRVEIEGVPADCAIIVSGDVDTREIMTKLKYMSLMVDSSEPSPEPDYVWEGVSKIAVSMEEDSVKGLTRIRHYWQAPRMSRASLQTTQAAIYEKAANELGEVACMMIRRGLCKQGIPYADVAFSYDNTPGIDSHECFDFEVTVASVDAEAARSIVDSALATLDRGEAGSADIILAENAYLRMLERSADKAVVGNDEYTKMCRNAFLYGTPLYSDRERLGFFRSKSVSEASRRKIFTDITSAMIEVDSQSDSAGSVSAGVMLSEIGRAHV